MLCKGCLEDKPQDSFPKKKDRSGRRRPYCQECINTINRKRYEAHKCAGPFKLRCSRAKIRAARLKVPFNLTPDYLEEIWTGMCPISHDPIHWSTDRVDENAAELDRIIPSEGYTQGNVVFLSRKMNRLKNNASLADLEKLTLWLRCQLNT